MRAVESCSFPGLVLAALPVPSFFLSLGPQATGAETLFPRAQQPHTHLLAHSLQFLKGFFTRGSLEFRCSIQKFTNPIPLNLQDRTWAQSSRPQKEKGCHWTFGSRNPTFKVACPSSDVNGKLSHSFFASEFTTVNKIKPKLSNY